MLEMHQKTDLNNICLFVTENISFHSSESYAPKGICLLYLYLDKI